MKDVIKTLFDSIIFGIKLSIIKIFIICFDLSSILLNVIIFSISAYAVYAIKKFNLIFNDSTISFISLTIYVLTLYGIFFAFLQFLIGNNSNKFFFWGINKIEFSILNKFVYRLVNTFATKLIIIIFVIIPIIHFVLSNLDGILFLDQILILISIWEVCLTYLIIVFGFLLTESLTALFIVFKIENNSDYHIKCRIKKFILKQALLSLKKGDFWYFFDNKKKSIENEELLNFIDCVYNGVLNRISIKMTKAEQDSCLYNKNSKISLDIFLNERWKHIEGLSVSEKIKLLEIENKSLNQISLFCKNENLFRKCLLKTENLFEPFYDILTDIKSAEDMKMLIEIMNHYFYFNLSDYENEYSDKLSGIISKLFDTIKNNFDIIANETVKRGLVELNRNKKSMSKKFFKLIYLHEFKNSEKEKSFIKFILETLDLNYIYAFIFYCVLHYGSKSETIFNNEIYYLREIYLDNNSYRIIDNQKICNLVEDTNIGHKVSAKLIIWILDNIDNDLNNEVIYKINNFDYLYYAKFLKIRFIFSDGHKEGRFSPEFFYCVKTDKLEKDVIDKTISSYFSYISSNIESLNYYFMSEHHDAFIKKFEDYLVSFIENQIRYYNHKHIILYLIKDVSKVKEYLLYKKFIFKYENREGIYIESYFMDFFILVFEDVQFCKMFNEDNSLKKYIKDKLEYFSKEGELDDYLEKLYLSIDKYHYFKKIKNFKEKVLKYFEITTQQQ